MTTRVVHRVRVRKKDNSQVWADMKVVDAVAVMAPNGQAHLLWTRAKDAVPLIIDNTGDGNGKGGSDSATRFSHMERIHSEDDPQQLFDIEVLDAIAFQPPRVVDSDGALPPLDDTTGGGGLPKVARFGKGPWGLSMASGSAIRGVVDKVGLGLGTDMSGPSRVGHIDLVTEKGNTDGKTDGIKDQGDTIPPQQLSWCAVLRTDGISFKAPGGTNIAILVPFNDQDEIDTTKLVKDPDTGEMVPPDNTDPNIYIAWPSGNDGSATAVGMNVKIPVNDTTGKKGPIDQGLLWWIDRIAPSFNPWFWFAPVQTPLAFSFFGSGGHGGWAWRGFVLWNNYPVIWILSANNAIVPMGTFGSPTLDLAARQGNWGDVGVPSSTFLALGRPPGSTVNIPFAAASLIGGDPGSESSGVTQTFAPFGCLPFTQAPLAKTLQDGMPYGIAGNDLWDGIPNIWQLVGTEGGLPAQPKRIKPGDPFDPFKNPYPPPSAKDAEMIVKVFKKNWNAVADGVNQFITQYEGDGGGDPKFTTPPGWNWAVPWYNAALGNSVVPEGYYQAFQNGIPPGMGSTGIPLEIYAPATVWNLDVDQLDRKVWDTTKMEFYNNPSNYFLPVPNPPTWASEKK